MKAKERIVIDETISGEEFFITDDTPIVDPYDFIEPFVEAKKFKISKRSIPYLLVQFVLFVLICLMKIVPIYKFRLPIRYSPAKIQYFCTTHFFNRNKATLRLDYLPFYNAEQSQKLSCDYYKNLSI